MKELEKILAVTLTGMSIDDFQYCCEDWMPAAKTAA